MNKLQKVFQICIPDKYNYSTNLVPLSKSYIDKYNSIWNMFTGLLVQAIFYYSTETQQLFRDSNESQLVAQSCGVEPSYERDTDAGADDKATLSDV